MGKGLYSGVSRVTTHPHKNACFGIGAPVCVGAIFVHFCPSAELLPVFNPSVLRLDYGLKHGLLPDARHPTKCASWSSPPGSSRYTNVFWIIDKDSVVYRMTTYTSEQKRPSHLPRRVYVVLRLCEAGRLRNVEKKEAWGEYLFLQRFTPLSEVLWIDVELTLRI